ncbi:MAG TPA: LpxL/LpxP family Kdo(2)-lipid IV(A) lauroyl/palmitoleoyl acyltransferase [Steroidobacteraceae bacterium]|nr:LpxL/LpxP family Kdo(2)-lipid IV(A) lauroyl/palmitoleoyl acyltransferase [Steroidobacteraceae bacterium]
MSTPTAPLEAAGARLPRWGTLLSPRYWPTWAGLGVLRLLTLLPFRVQLAIGAGLGRLLRRLPVRFVRIARRNIELCLPELDAAQRRRLLDRHFTSLGIALSEIAMAWWWPTPRLQTISRIEGMEHMRAALERGRGAILLTAHFTPLEIGGRIVAAATPVNIVYRPSKNEALAHVLGRCRSRNGGRAIPRDDIRSMIAALKRNEVVWYAPDQSYRKKGAEMVSLFGIPAPTNTATSRIARMTGAAVLPYFVERLPGSAGYRVVIQPPLESYPSECPRADAERFHRLIEAQVRAVPDQYLWIHRRFKGMTAADPNFYGRDPAAALAARRSSAVSPVT